MYISTLSSNLAQAEVAVQIHGPAILPPGKTRYPLYRKLGSLQGPYRDVRKISLPQLFDPRTVQSVASRYTDYGIPTHRYINTIITNHA